MATATSVPAIPMAVSDLVTNSEKTMSVVAQSRPITRFSWEKGPMTLIPTPLSTSAQGTPDQYTLVASEMALVHNCIIRALNSIYIQAPHIPSSEYKNFVNYCLATCQGLKAHHDGEEDFLFPELEKVPGALGLMVANIKGHQDFKVTFAEWQVWLTTCKAEPYSFSPGLCRTMLDAFIPPLSTHFVAEIQDLLSLAHFGDKMDLLGLMKKDGEKVMGGMSKTTQLPIFLTNHDITWENGIHDFPPIPPPVRWVLREVAARKKSAWWKFSTCGFDGRPRELKWRGED